MNLLTLMSNPTVQRLAMQPRKLMAILIAITVTSLIGIGVITQLLFDNLLITGAVVIACVVTLLIGAYLAQRRMKAQMAEQMAAMQQMMNMMGGGGMEGLFAAMGDPNAQAPAGMEDLFAAMGDPNAQPPAGLEGLFGDGSLEHEVPPSATTADLQALLQSMQPPADEPESK